MSRYSDKLTTTEWNAQVLRAQLGSYIDWLSAKPGRVGYVFPASKGRCLRVRVRNEVLGARAGGGYEVVTVDPTDYLPGKPVPEPYAATSSETIAEFIDPTGGLRKAGLLVVQIVGDREAA